MRDLAEEEVGLLTKRRDQLLSEIASKYAPDQLPPGILGKVGDALLLQGQPELAKKFYEQILSAHAKSIFADYGYVGLGEVFVFVFFGVVASVGSTYVQVEEITGLIARTLEGQRLAVDAVMLALAHDDVPSARGLTEELAALPQSGRIIATQVDVPGLPVNFVSV